LKHEFTGSRRKTTLVVLQTELEVLKAFYTKFQNGDEATSQEGGRPSGDPVDQCPTQEGEPQSKTIGGKDYHWCVGNNAHKPMGSS
jgi:hypothetical protein